MEATFIFLLFVFVLIIFIILLNFKSSTIFNQRMIIKKLDKLTDEIEIIKSTGINLIQDGHKKSIKIEEIIEPQIKKQVTVEEPVLINPEIPQEKKMQTENAELKETILSQNNSSPIYQNIEKSHALKQDRKTDFEKFIGENLLNKIGIVILILALIFFGKYAVDKGWLNETAKVVAIILIGGILIGIAHRLRVNYKAFSSVLAGGGIAALYIAIAVGFQLYGLFSQTAAFLILIVITILAVLLSLAYDKKELAVIAIFGGFATPIMVSTGAGNYKVLFTYILILDIGMLVLSYFKKWNLVNFVANIATVILYMAWIIDILFANKQLPHQGALLFVSGFYLVFFLMNIINNIKENSKFTAFEFIMLIANTFLYYWAGMVTIQNLNSEYMGLFTILLAIFNFVFAFPLYRRKQIDKNLIFLLIGLVLTFASISIPVQFEGNYITMFWAAESVLLLWLSQQSGIRLMKLAAYVVTYLMLISLSMDWYQIYFDKYNDSGVLPLLINKGFITGIVSIIGLIINILLLKNDKAVLYLKSFSSELFSRMYLILLLITLYMVIFFEISYQVDTFFDNSDLSYVALAFYNYLYIAAILIWTSLKRIKYIVHTITIIAFFGILIYVFVVAPHFKLVLSKYLIGELNSSFALLHYLNALLVLLIGFYSLKNLKDIFNANKFIFNISTWYTIIIGIVVLSFELDYLMLHITMPEYNLMPTVLHQNHLVGWPILWGAIAFTLLFVGIRRNEKMYRIIGISVFFFTLIKFFIIDLWDMPAGGQVIASGSLAILILVIAFMYQKLKRMLLTDDLNETKETENEK